MLSTSLYNKYASVQQIPGDILIAGGGRRLWQLHGRQRETRAYRQPLQSQRRLRRFRGSLGAVSGDGSKLSGRWRQFARQCEILLHYEPVLTNGDAIRSDKTVSIPICRWSHHFEIGTVFSWENSSFISKDFLIFNFDNTLAGYVWLSLKEEIRFSALLFL